MTRRPSGSSVTAVTRPPMLAVSMSGGTRICDQSRRRMVSTASTRKPWVWPLYSVTIMMSRGESGCMPAYLARSTTGTRTPRRTDHALDRGRHVRRRGDRRRAHHFAHLEHVDAVSLVAPGARVHAERKQQDLQLVGAGQRVRASMFFSRSDIGATSSSPQHPAARGRSWSRVPESYVISLPASSGKRSETAD